MCSQVCVAAAADSSLCAGISVFADMLSCLTGHDWAAYVFMHLIITGLIQMPLAARLLVECWELAAAHPHGLKQHVYSGLPDDSPHCIALPVWRTFPQ
jgi:hypothetical protein